MGKGACLASGDHQADLTDARWVEQRCAADLAPAEAGAGLGQRPVHGLPVERLRQALAGSLIGAQDGDDVLPIAEQADDIQVVFSFKVQPLHGEVGDAPGTQARDLA